LKTPEEEEPPLDIPEDKKIVFSMPTRLDYL
jgi:hypothetical protein